MIFVYIIVFISFLISILYFIFDFYPFVMLKVRKKFIKKASRNRISIVLKTIIIDRSYDLFKKDKFLMVWNDKVGVSEILFNFFRPRGGKSFKKYNYPNAFLMYGLIKIFKDEKSHADLFKSDFDKVISSQGGFKFNFDKVDQATYGLVCLELYEMYNEKKYLDCANYIYEFIYDIYSNNNNIILYRNNDTVWLNDMIGLVIPFLVKYYEVTKIKESILIAKEQMTYYIKYGIDTNTYMPAHGIDLITKVKVGSMNWGRGIGWYFLGLKEIYEFDGSFSKEYLELSNTLMKLKSSNGLWTQFPGSSSVFDSSASLMFLYCLPKDLHSIDDLLVLLDQYISKDGYILDTSGDTYDLNVYSKTFGKSELSQGMMLLLLDRYK